MAAQADWYSIISSCPVFHPEARRLKNLLTTSPHFGWSLRSTEPAWGAPLHWLHQEPKHQGSVALPQSHAKKHRHPAHQGDAALPAVQRLALSPCPDQQLPLSSRHSWTLYSSPTFPLSLWGLWRCRFCTILPSLTVVPSPPAPIPSTQCWGDHPALPAP